MWMRNLLYHLHTASQSLVKILCGQSGCWPVGLGMSKLIMNLLRYALTDELFNLVSLCVVTSRGCRSATYTFLIYRLSVVVTSVVGQLDRSCDDLCGPFPHGVVVLKAQFLLKWDPQDWIEMAHVSILLKMFLMNVGYCCLQLSSICLVDPVSNGRTCPWVGLIRCAVECR
jgi:hypothetical protein